MPLLVRALRARLGDGDVGGGLARGRVGRGRGLGRAERKEHTERKREAELHHGPVEWTFSSFFWGESTFLIRKLRSLTVETADLKLPCSGAMTAPTLGENHSRTPRNRWRSLVALPRALLKSPRAPVRAQAVKEGWTEVEFPGAS